MVTALICGGIAITSLNTVAFIVCGLLWLGLMPLWRAMAKADPQLVDVYLRSLIYRGYYPAFSRPYRKR